MPDITLGDYEIDDDSNGDLVIRDPGDTIVFRWDETNSQWNLEQQDITNLNSLETEEVNNTFYAETGDNLQSKLDALGTDDELVILPGTHTISSSNSPLSPPDNCTITVMGTVELEDSDQSKIIERTNGPVGITIRGPGELVGNRDTVTFTSKGDHRGIDFNGEGIDNITIRGITVRNILSDSAIRVIDGGTTIGDSATDIGVEDCTVKNCGDSLRLCDGIGVAGEEIHVSGNTVENVTDTHLLLDSVKRVEVSGEIYKNTSTFNTNNQDANQGFVVFARDRNCEAVTIDNVLIHNLGSNARGFSHDSANATNDVVEPLYSNIRITGTFNIGINSIKNDVDGTYSDIFVDGSAGDSIAYGGSGAQFNGVTIKSPGSRAIDATGEMSILGGRIEGASGIAVLVSGADSVVEGLRVHNGSTDAIRISGSSGVVCTDNRITSCGRGFHLTGGCTDCEVSGNVVSGSTNQDLRSPNSANNNNIYANNRFTSTSAYDVSGDESDSLFVGNRPEFYHVDTTNTVTGGGSTTVTLGFADLGNDVRVDATPANDPNNDHGYTVDKVFWDDSVGSMKATVSETENAGGGDVRVTAKLAP